MNMITLTNRENQFLIYGVIFLLIFGIIQFIFLPVLEKRNLLKDQVKIEATSLEEIIELQKIQSKSSNKNARQDNIFKALDKKNTHFSFINALASRTNVKDNVVYMQPSSKDSDDSNYVISQVKIKIGSAYLKELIDFIALVETSDRGVAITSLSISKTGKDKKLVDAIIETETMILIESVNGKIE